MATVAADPVVNESKQRRNERGIDERNLSEHRSSSAPWPASPSSALLSSASPSSAPASSPPASRKSGSGVGEASGETSEGVNSEDSTEIKSDASKAKKRSERTASGKTKKAKRRATPFQPSMQERRGGVSLTMLPPKPTAHARINRDDKRVTPAYVRRLIQQGRVRDQERQILRLTWEVGYVTPYQAARIIFPAYANPVQKARETMRRMYDDFLLDRADGSGLSVYGLPSSAVYVIGKAGALILQEEIPAAKRWQKGGTLLLNHNVLLGEAIIEMALLAQKNDCQFVFYGERAATTFFIYDGIRVSLRADGLAYITYPNGRERGLFLEMDTGSREIAHFATKALQYSAYFRSGAWQYNYAKFPGVAIIAWAPSMKEDEEEAQRQRIRLAIRRINNAIPIIQARSRPGVAWFFTTLAHLKRDYWWAISPNPDRRILSGIHLFARRRKKANAPELTNQQTDEPNERQE